LAASIGSNFICCVPTTTSTTPAERLISFSPSCCATQPVTATIGSRPSSRLVSLISPSRV
jgi:hypothetical protein